VKERRGDGGEVSKETTPVLRTSCTQNELFTLPFAITGRVKESSAYVGLGRLGGAGGGDLWLRTRSTSSSMPLISSGSSRAATAAFFMATAARRASSSASDPEASSPSSSAYLTWQEKGAREKKKGALPVQIYLVALYLLAAEIKCPPIHFWWPPLPARRARLPHGYAPIFASDMGAGNLLAHFHCCAGCSYQCVRALQVCSRHQL